MNCTGILKFILIFFIFIQILPSQLFIKRGNFVTEASWSESKEYMYGKVLRIAVFHVSVY